MQSQDELRSYLARLEAQLDLHLAGLCAHPHVDLQKGAAAGLSPQSHWKIWAQESLVPPAHLPPIVQQHDVIISQVILAEI